MAAHLFALVALAAKKAVVEAPTPVPVEPLSALVTVITLTMLASLYFMMRSPSSFSAYTPATAKGGCEIDAKKTAVVAIEFQNEFATEGGKLHPAVKGVMKSTGMLAKARIVVDTARTAGAKVIHSPIMFKEDASDNPNKALGILAGCAKDQLFTAGTWNSEFCTEMKPAATDSVVKGKKGLDAFPNTNLDALLKGVETVVLMGFLTNCCVESTMRTACEKGYNVITITDGCATVSEEGQAAATGGTFGMFSTPMTADEFVAKIGVGATPSTAAAM